MLPGSGGLSAEGSGSQWGKLRYLLFYINITEKGLTNFARLRDLFACLLLFCTLSTSKVNIRMGTDL